MLKWRRVLAIHSYKDISHQRVTKLPSIYHKVCFYATHQSLFCRNSFSDTTKQTDYHNTHYYCIDGD